MSSKHAVVAALSFPLTSSSRNARPTRHAAVRAVSSLTASSRYGQVSPLDAGWARRERLRPSSLSPFVKRADRIRAFCVSTPLLKEKEQAGQDIAFKQYKFEDISSTLFSSASSSDPSSPSQPSTPILIDVREPAELAATGKIPTALCLPIGSQPDALFLSKDEFLTRFGFPKPSTSQNTGAAEEGEKGKGGNDLVFYCKAGVRAKAAAQLAVQAGYDPKRIGVYEGSWLDWEKRGGQVEKWDGSE
ncbi:hypothetical protein VTO42DRAFT_6021 [Malbranchea cinnamomea]